MQNKKAKTTAEVSRFYDRITALGCMIHSGAQAEIHHIAGHGAKHNKVLIGPKFVLPLSPEEHRLNTPNATHQHRQWCDKWGRVFMRYDPYGFEKALFVRLLIDYWLEYGEAPPISAMEFLAMMTYRK